MKRLFLVLAWLAGSYLSVSDATEPMDMAVQAVNDFAIAHHRLMPAGNVIVSPWSIQNSLVMLAAGANGSTRDALLLSVPISTPAGPC